MAQSLFKTLKSLHPDCRIDVLAPTWSKDLLARMPEVAQAFALPLGHGVMGWKVRRQVAVALKTKKYDKAFVLPNSWKSALIPWFSGIPKRTGWCGELRFGLLNDIRFLDKARYPLMIERFVALAYPPKTVLPKVLPFPKLKVDLRNIEAALHKFAVQKSEKGILALCPGAEFGPSKRWPEQYYAQTAKQKLKEGYAVWMFGSAKDSEVAAKINAATDMKCIDFTGKTNLGEALDLLSLVNVVLTNDSGLMHVAAALEKPLVAVYGSTDPGFTPPLTKHAEIVRMQDLPCSPCFKRVCPLGHHQCMLGLMPAVVLSALQKCENGSVS